METGREGTHQTINLWSTLIELDGYYRELGYVEKRVPKEAFAGISLYEDVISELVKIARSMSKCVHYAQEAGCKVCGLRVRLLDIKLQRYTAQLRLGVRGSSLQPICSPVIWTTLVHGLGVFISGESRFTDGSSSIEPRLWMTLFPGQDSSDSNTAVKLSDEVVKIERGI